MGGFYSRSLHVDSYVRMKEFVCQSSACPFRWFSSKNCREFRQRLGVALHGTLGSYLRDALHDGNSDDVVACLLAPRA
jgi:hypothetical protein